MPSAIPEPDGNAPSYTVANKRFISIEHPCIVRDADNGLKSLGGEHQLKHAFETKRKASTAATGLGSSVAISFRPDDFFAQRITSTPLSTQNVLVKVTLPKKTGRKRKRGSEEPFVGTLEPTHHNRITASALLQRMRDNPTKYRVEPLGIIEETHLFSRLPDYQIRADEAPVMREIRDRVALPRYDNLRKFRTNLQSGSVEVPCFPGPPVFTMDNETNIWEARHEQQRRVPSPKPTPGQRRRQNPHAPAGRARNEAVAMDAERVPQGPPPDLPPPGLAVERALGPMRALLEKRPLVTCRAACALLKDFPMKTVASTIPYVGYFAGKGPWRDAIVKYGIDPRSDAKYRKYQTLIFRVYATREVNSVLRQRGQEVETHVFNGQTMSQTAAIWQLCDLTDPLIAEALDTTDIRTDCDKEKHGWYFNGTIAKVRVLMREKMRCILNELPIPDDDYYRVLNTLPSLIMEKEECELPASYPAEVRQLAQDIAKAARRGEPKPFKILKSTMNGPKWDSGSDAAETEAGDDWEDDGMHSGDDDAQEIPGTYQDVDMTDEPPVERAEQ